MESEKTPRARFKEILETTVIRNYDNQETKQAKIKNFCKQVQENFHKILSFVLKIFS